MATYIFITTETEIEYRFAFFDSGQPFSLLIGRDMDCDIVLPKSLSDWETVSRMHLRFYRTNDDFWVEDLGSRNFTRVDGRITLFPQRVTLPCNLILGNVSLAITCEDSDEDTVSALNAAWDEACESDGVTPSTVLLDTASWEEVIDVDLGPARWMGSLLNAISVLSQARSYIQAERSLRRVLSIHLEADHIRIALDIPIAETTKILIQLDLDKKSAQLVHDKARDAHESSTSPSTEFPAFHLSLSDSERLIWGVVGQHAGVPVLALVVGQFSGKPFAESGAPQVARMITVTLQMAVPALRNLRELEAFRAAQIYSAPRDPHPTTIGLSDELGFWGESRAIRDCLFAAESAAQRYLELKTGTKELKVICLQGEVGTGKSAMAAVIHRLSKRKSEDLVRASADGLVETLAESQILGIREGAATNITRDLPGWFHTAHNKMLFIDDINHIPAGVQSKFMTVLSEGIYTWIGDAKPSTTDAHVIVATNQNLGDLVAKGNFAPDLRSRLETFPIVIPPLRKRREDIPLLIDRYVTALRERNEECCIEEVSKDLNEAFVSYDWPENVRELVAMLQGAVVMAMATPGKTALDWEDLLPHHRIRLLAKRTTLVQLNSDTGLSRNENVAALERDYTARLLGECHGRMEECGVRSGARGTFLRMEKDLKKYLATATAEDAARYKVLAGEGWRRIDPD